MSSGNIAICTNISLIFFSSSIVLARYPVPSRSGREPLGDPIFEEEAGNGETGTSVPSLARHENKWETTKLGRRHLDKAKPEALVKV